MPLSELLRLATGEIESSQQGSFPTDIAPPVENDLAELVWENGQIMMQSQSTRGTATGSLAPNSLPGNTNRTRDAAVEHHTCTRNDKFSRVESTLNHMSPVVPSGELDSSHNDEMVPWLSYPIGDALPRDYTADLLPEISGVTATGTSTQNSFVFVDRRSSCDQTVSNLHNGENTFKVSTSKASSWLLQHRQTSDALGSGLSDIISNNDRTSHRGGVYGNSVCVKDRVYSPTSMKMERPGLVQHANNLNLLNFPQFSRPATLVKTNLPDSEKVPMSVSSRVESLEVKEKVLGASSSKPLKLMVVDRSNSVQEDVGFHVSSSKLAREPTINVPKDSCPPERTEKLSKNPCGPLTPIVTSNPLKGVPLSDKTVEPVVASSSVGSGHSADRVSCEQSQNPKRKFHDIEESECPSDDIETGSYGIKKITPRVGNSSKRSRAAEVHNLSERRRRDRINEKMRALQELIPNCNKVDKASMLDEAIEYLKTLQLQVQIMSMGTGLCMPSPVMFPPGMQHMRPSHVPQFSPLGFGMGMMDMSGGGCPVYPVPVPVPHFPSPMSAPVNLPRIPAYGHPSQGIPNLIPLVPPVTSAISLKSGNCNEILSSSNCGDQVTNKNPQSVLDAEASSSKHHQADQFHATNVVDDHPKVHKNKEAGTDNRK